MSDSNSINVRPGFVGIGEGFFDDWHYNFKMIAGGDLRNHAAVFGKNIDLGDNDVAQNMTAIFNDSGSGFVTRSFNSQD